MAMMFVSVLVLAVVSQAFGATVPAPEFPEKYLGTYESQPENDQNFAQFATFFKLPTYVDWSKPNTLYVYREGEYFKTSIVFSPYVPPFELKYRLGELTTATVNGRNAEYVLTVENEADGTPVLKGKFRDTEADAKFTMEARFGPNGINATYVREGVTARRTYVRTACPTIGGLYENVPERQSPNFVEFATRVFPAPRGVTFDSTTLLWLGRYGKDFVVKYLITPSVYVKFPFTFGEKRTQSLNGKNVTYTYTLVGEDFTTKTTTIRAEFITEDGKLTLDAAITPEGITATYKAGEQTASRYYKRVLNALVYGDFESVPASVENWSEFARQSGKEDDSTQLTRVQIYRQGTETYFRVVRENGETNALYPFTLNKVYETTGPKGVPVKYTFTEKPSYSNDAILSAKYEFGNKTFQITMTFNATGVYTIYRAGPLVARRFFRRALPAYALGKFESTPDTPEFAQFTQTVGAPELTKKTTIEFAAAPEGNYLQTITVEGAPAPAPFPFTLGKTSKTSMAGREFTYNYFYFEYPVPVLHTSWTESNGPASFAVAAEFNPTGYTATYLAKGRVATRTYKRVGAPVEKPAYPTTA